VRDRGSHRILQGTAFSRGMDAGMRNGVGGTRRGHPGARTGWSADGLTTGARCDATPGMCGSTSRLEWDAYGAGWTEARYPTDHLLSCSLVSVASVEGAPALPRPLWPPYHVIHLCCCPLRVEAEAAQHVHCLVAGQEAKGYRKRASAFPRCEGVLRPPGQGGAGLEPV
jgi:hypothetical protein